MPNYEIHVPVIQTQLPDGSYAHLALTPDLPEPNAVKGRDRRWFEQHPDATYRIRRVYPDELDQPGRWVVVIRHDGPGFRTRLPIRGRARPSDDHARAAALYYREQLSTLAKEIAKL